MSTDRLKIDVSFGNINGEDIVSWKESGNVAVYQTAKCVYILRDSDLTLIAMLPVELAKQVVDVYRALLQMPL